MEGKGDNSTGNAPTKGLNSASAKGDTAPAPVSSQPLTNSLPANVPPPPPVNSLPQASNLAQAPKIPPVNSPPQASNLAQAFKMPPGNSLPQASNLTQAFKMPPVNSPSQASNLAQAPNMRPVNSLPQASNLAQAFKMPPVNSPPQASNLAQAFKMPPVNSPSQTSNLAQAPNMRPVNSPPQTSNLAQAPNMPPVNSPPQASNLAQAPKMPPVNSPPQASNLAQAPKMPPVNSPPQASNLAQAFKVPPVNSPPQASNLAQAFKMPPVNSLSQASNLAQAPNMRLVNSPPQTSNLAQAPNMPPVNSPPQASNLAQAPKMPPVNSPPQTSNLAQAPNMPPVTSPPQASNLAQAPNIPVVNSPPQATNLTQAPNMPPVTSPPQASNLVQAPNVPLVNLLPQAASTPPVNLPLQASNVGQTSNIPALNSPPLPNTPPALDSYCPAGHFNKFTSSPNYMPQSSYNPMGPALSPPPAPNVPQQQSTTNTIIVQLGGPTSAPVSDFNFTNYMRNPTKYISADDYSDAYEGAANQLFEVKEKKSFLHAITCGKLKGRGYFSAILINVVRLIYFIFQFIYPIIQAIVEGGPVLFNVICTLFAFVGLVYDVIQIVIKLKEVKEKNRIKEERERKIREERANKEGGQDDTVEDTNSEPKLEGVANPQELLVDQIIKDDTATAAALKASGIPVKKTKTDKSSTEEKTKTDKSSTEEKTKTDKSSTEEKTTTPKTTTPKRLLYDFVQDMLEEIIIYPSLICNLYGFINEKGWEFNNAFDGFDFLLTFISFVMDAVWAKVNHIWILYQLVKSTVKIQERKNIYSYATPFNLFVPYSIGLAVAHTLMVMLIGIRIYADNFNTRVYKDAPQQKMGNYTVAPYTRYMIFCGAYLPLMSGACYIILNKHWFLQVSWILYNGKDAADKMHYNYITSMPTRVKLFGFLRDKYAYISVATFAPLFIAFYNGGFLQDYDPNDLPDGAANAAGIIGTLFVIVFSIINIQAGIIFTIIIILLMITLCFICTGGGSSSSARKKIIR